MIISLVRLKTINEFTHAVNPTSKPLLFHITQNIQGIH